MELERELLIRLSRITFNQNEENDIKDILTNNRIADCQPKRPPVPYLAASL